jgi:hypothetical protein
MQCDVSLPVEVSDLTMKRKRKYALFLIATAPAVSERSVIRARTDSLPALSLCANYGPY